MKNLIKGMFIASVLALFLSACDKDADVPYSGPVTHPQEEEKSTYSGDWSRQEVGKEEVLLGKGTVTFTPAEDNYVTNIEVKCTDFSLDMSSIANIAPGAQGYIFYNTSSSNGFETIFSGDIKKTDMSVDLSFKKTVKEGRKSYTYLYTFNGVRQ